MSVVRRSTVASRTRSAVAAMHAFFLLLSLCFVPLGRGQDVADHTNRLPAFSPEDERLLDQIEQAGFRFFWESACPRTGLVKDRSRAAGQDARRVASIAATGFGLTALCIGDERGYEAAEKIRERVRTTLRYLWREFPEARGFFYHFVDWESGERLWECELSSIDTAILLCGVLSCREHFVDTDIRELARQIYERVDWPWMLDGGQTFSHGWKPESGFLKNRWNTYAEAMMIYLLALGSSTHPVPAEVWDAWNRTPMTFQGYHYFSAKAPIFIHQYSHAWFDFRGRRDAYGDYFSNSVTATRAHLEFCLGLQPQFPWFSRDLWGISASDSAKGYVAWGGPPAMGPLDGTVVPCATAGALPFLPRETMRVLRFIHEKHRAAAWRRYGFVDAFNPGTGWVDDDVIGIDTGISVLMAENARTGLVWSTFMKNPEMQRAMTRAGFHRAEQPSVAPAKAGRAVVAEPNPVRGQAVALR